jgi:hypothetical protein
VNLYGWLVSALGAQEKQLNTHMMESMAEAPEEG